MLINKCILEGNFFRLQLGLISASMFYIIHAHMLINKCILEGNFFRSQLGSNKCFHVLYHPRTYAHK